MLISGPRGGTEGKEDVDGSDREEAEMSNAGELTGDGKK